MTTCSFRLRHVPVVSITLCVGAALLYSQLAITEWFFTLGGGMRYCRGWPLPCMLLAGTPPTLEDFYLVRFVINVLVSVTIVGASALVFALWTRARFQITLLQVLAIVTAICVLFAVRRFVPIVNAPHWTPWYVRAAVLFGMGCTIYAVGAISIKLVFIAVGKWRAEHFRREVDSPTKDMPKMKPPNVTRRLIFGGALVAYSLLFGGHTGRIRPGGPFISIFGDALPFLAAALSVFVVVGCLRARSIWPKLACLLLSIIAAIAMKRVIIDIYAFHIRSRGDFLGW